MKKRLVAAVVIVCMAAGLMACGGKGATKEATAGSGEEGQSEEVAANDQPGDAEEGQPEDAGSSQSEEVAANDQSEDTENSQSEAAEDVEIQVFIAASLNTVMTDLAERYQASHPNVKITYNADSSGTLLTQIEEGYECDIFFSAAQKQMDQLEADGLAVEGTRKNVVNNQVVVLTLKDSGTAVTGLENLADAKNIALAGGSVPVGKYTRQALVNLGLLDAAEDVSEITTQEVSEALGGVEISEQDNVSKVLIAVTEGACEVGTTYYSDTYGFEDQVDILEQVSYDLTGNVIYPICLVQNPEGDEAQREAAEEFLDYVLSEEAKAVFESFYFDTDVE